jgi:hypothetical protein
MIFEKIESQIKNIDYKPKYITLSTIHRNDVNGDKFNKLELEPFYDDTLSDRSIFVT